MRRAILGVMVIAVAFVGAASFAASKKTATFTPPAGWADVSWQTVSIVRTPDADPVMAGSQPGVCVTVTACSMAPSGMLADCSETVRCTASPPSSVTGAVEWILGQWGTEHGY